MYKKIIFIILAASSYFLSALADDSNPWLGGCETDYPPYNFIKNGKPVGMDTELVELVMNKMQQKFIIQPYPWARVVQSLKKGQVDFAWQFVSTPERVKDFNFVGPIRYGTTVFAVEKNSPIKDWKTLDDLKTKKIGVVRAFRYTREFDLSNAFQKDESNNNELMLKKLLNHEIDIAIGDLNTLTYISKVTGNLKNVRFLPTPIKDVPRYIGFAKKEIVKAKKFQQALKQVKDTPEYLNIIKKYTYKMD